MGTKYRRPRGATGLSYKDDPTAYQRNYWRLVRSEAVAALGGICQVCGEADPVVLDIDHVDGDGHLQLLPGGKKYRYKVYKDVLDGRQDGYQLLCCNCHRRKTLAAGDHLARS